MQHRVDAYEGRLHLLPGLGDVPHLVLDTLHRSAAEAAEFVFVAQVLEGQASDQSAGTGNQDFSSFHVSSYSRARGARQAWIAVEPRYCFVTGYRADKLGALLSDEFCPACAPPSPPDLSGVFFKPQWSESEKTPSILDVISATSTGAINRFNGENSELVQESIEAWRREAGASAEGKAAAAGARPRIYFIGVNFRQLASPEERQYFNSLPTRFKLSGESVDRLVDAGGRILRESPEFQKLLADLAPAR